MIENIDLDAGTFELHGQVIKIPEGVDILKYINSEVELLESFDVEDVEADA